LYDDWLSIGGIELINAERTQTYVEHMLPQMGLQKVADMDLHVALEDAPYTSPVLDDAEWVSAADTASHKFYGLYPKSLEGFGNSTRTASVTESTLQGGFVGAARDGSRPLRVNGLLIAADEEGAEAGLSWLRAVVKNIGCSTHDSSCNSSDMTFFLGKPNACDPLYDMSQHTVSDTITVGTHVTTESPLIYRIPADRDVTQPGHMRFGILAADAGNEGVIVSYGRMGIKDPSIEWESDPIVVFRKNLITVPDGAPNVAPIGWSLAATSGTPNLTRELDLSNAGYFHATSSAAGTVRTNWVPDAGDTLQPGPSGWMSNATAQSSNTVDVLSTRSGRAATFTAPGHDPDVQLFASKAFVGPNSSDVGVIAFDVLFGSNLTVIFEDNFGKEMFRDNPSLSSGWNHLEYPSLIGAGYSVTLATFDDSITVGSLLAEVGGTSTSAWFDGGLPTASGVTYSYVGGNVTGASQAITTGSTQITASTTLTTTLPGALVGSVEIRTDAQTPVTIEIWDANNSRVLGTQTVNTTTDWQKFIISSDVYYKASQLRIKSTNQVDFRRVIVEHGDIQNLDYFDGSTAIPGYDILWTGRPNFSASTMRYTDGEPLGFTEDDSDFRPFLRVLSGEATNVFFTSDYYQTIPVSEQLRQIRRTYHSVKATAGPTVISKNNFYGGTVYEIEILFTAENPSAFSDTVEVLTPTAAKSFYNKLIVDAQNTERNLISNGGFDGDIGPWILTGTPGSTGTALNQVNYAAGAQPAPNLGTVYGQAVYTTTGSTVYTGDVRQPANVKPGALYSGSVWVTANRAGAPVRLRLVWSDSSYYDIGASWVVVTPTTPIVAGVWQRLAFTGVLAPPGAVFAVVHVELVNSNVSTTVSLDGLCLFESLDNTYWDGNTPDDLTFHYDYTNRAVRLDSYRIRRPLTSTQFLVDPSQPVLPAPPTPPAITNSGLTTQYSWRRYFIPIEAGEIATWADTLPTVLINTLQTAVRNVRVRFFPNPFGYAPDDIDPLSFCGGYLVSYLVQDAQLQINGMAEAAFANVGGLGYDPADFLLYGTDGSPVTWPTLSCEIPYMMVIDVQPTASLTDFQFGLNLNRRE
jgi:hypothetical protein